MTPPMIATSARPSPLRIAARILLHGVFLVIAVGCFLAYGHFKAAGEPTASYVALAAAALFGFAPVRDIVRVFFAVEGRTLHLVHGLGGLALLALPLAGVVSSGKALSRAAMAPFAIMGAAQAVMHQDHPRNAEQAAALRAFARSLPEIAQFAGAKDLSTPENAQRAIAVLTDIVAKAQALGETELQSDPGFQNALTQVSSRMGANMGLDAVDLALDKLASDPATASAVRQLREQIATARQTLGDGGKR